MDVTSINLGSKTRDELREYRDEHGHGNYDEAVQELLNRVEAEA